MTLGSVLRLGEKVLDLRIERGLTQMQLAAQAGLGHSFITALETGRKRYVRAEEVEALALGLGVEPEELWGAIPARDGGKGGYIPLHAAA